VKASEAAGAEGSPKQRSKIRGEIRTDQGARFVPLPVFLSLPAVFCLILRGCFG